MKKNKLVQFKSMLRSWDLCGTGELISVKKDQKREKMLGTSIFFISHYVFEILLPTLLKTVSAIAKTELIF